MGSKTIKLVVLDRDGVINKDFPDYVKSPEEWFPIPGSLEAIAKLKKHGLKIAVATNQSGIGRGYYSLETLDAIHQKMLRELKKVGGEIDQIFFCPHTPEDNCECRKPKPGLLEQAAKKFNCKPHEMIMIGDATRDMLAAKNFGVKSIFVKSSHKEKDLLEAKESNIPVFDDLASAAEFILTA